MANKKVREIRAGAVAGIFAGLLAGAAATPAFSRAIAVVGDYGWSTLAILPFLMGFATMLLLGFKEERTLAEGAVATLWSLFFFVLVATGFLLEGAICLLMASPIILGVALFGTMVGFQVHKFILDRRARLQISFGALLLPLGVNFALHEPTAFEEREVTTTAWLSAPPEEIWPYLENIERLPEPKFWLFRLGVAHPQSAWTEGDIRHCVLSTGDMPERLVVRKPSQELSWRVLKTPPLVNEINPFGRVHAPHDEGRLVIRTGGWLLKREGGGTRVIARTQYGHRFGAPLYWNLWTDAVVGNVHRQVIDEISDRTGR
ncbi:hypothetical protein EON81_13390 [bacterium]|nr:MAG: hypothetical protein EON81_13390 [bacterium]